MKTSIIHRTVILSVILLSGSFHNDSALADSCPTPSFASAGTFDAGPGAWALAVGDFNRDGHADLAVAKSGSTNISVLLGNGDGTFQAAVKYGPGAAPSSLAAGDFNGDGRLDLGV